LAFQASVCGKLQQRLQADGANQNFEELFGDGHAWLQGGKETLTEEKGSVPAAADFLQIGSRKAVISSSFLRDMVTLTVIPTKFTLR
jgi:hypothetical protein